MEIIYFIIAWYVIGYISIILTFRMWGKVTIGDLFQALGLALLGGFLTLVCIVVSIIELSEKIEPYWDKIKDKEVF